MTSSGSLEHCCTQYGSVHTHKHALIHSSTTLQQQLYLDPLCECVQRSVFMDVVQMVTSHCEAQSLPSPPVPRLGSSGTSCRLLRHGERVGSQRHQHTNTHAQIFNHSFIKNPVTSLCTICTCYFEKADMH